MRDDETLLRRLLSGWRLTRAPALEDAIDRVGEVVARARGGALEGKGTRLEAAWHALAATAEPGDVDRLLATAWPKELAAAVARVRALSAFPPDPRISFVVAGAAASYRDAAARELHRAFAALFARAPSARLLPRLDVIEAARGEMTHALYRDLRALIAALEPRDPDPTLLDAARARTGDRVDLDRLWAQHAADPGDANTRAVLADGLQVAGDPRGELIALQLAGDERRAQQLLAKHIDTWTGPLPGIVPASRRFARGFLVAAHVKLDAARLARAIERIEWVTLEALELEGEEGDVVALVKRMPLLARLVAPRWAIERIAKARACPQLRALATDGIRFPDRLAFPALEVFVCDALAYGPRSIAKHAHQVAELGMRAVGYRDLRMNLLGPLLRGRGTLDLRLTIEAWHVRVTGERAELAFGPGRHGRQLAEDIVQALETAGVRELERKPRVDLLA